MRPQTLRCHSDHAGKLFLKPYVDAGEEVGERDVFRTRRPIPDNWGKEGEGTKEKNTRSPLVIQVPFSPAGFFLLLLARVGIPRPNLAYFSP